MFNLFLAVVRRDLMLALRQKTDIVQTLFFFAVVITLVPLGVGAEQELLRSMAPGVIWVAALLAALLSLPRIFAHDYTDGTLEQMIISAEPLTVIVLAKVFAHWLVTGIPITIFTAVFGIMFDLPLEQTSVLMASLLLGTPVLSLVGAIGAALTLGLRAGSVLTSLLVLPLYIPVLTFGAGATVQVAISVSPTAYLMVTAALSFLALAAAPFAISAALRISIQ
ncbi:MAG: heme exporter protein CcmB [Duodenibacillus sp.]